MESFDDRQKAFEDKFAHDEELKFKATVRAAKLLGEWVAKEVGLTSDIYAAELINLVTAGKDEEDIFKKVLADALAKGKNLTKPMVEEKYASCVNEAKRQVLNR